MKFLIATFIGIVSLASTTQAAPLLDISTTHMGKAFRTLTVDTNGEVAMVENAKETLLFTLASAHVTSLQKLVDSLTDFTLVDQTPNQVPCPAHMATDYRAYSSSGKVRTIFQIASSCHRFGPQYPEGGQAGAEAVLYSKVNELVKTLDLTDGLFFNLVYGQ